MIDACDGTVTWMGVTATSEQIWALRQKGLNPWLTLIFGRPVPADPSTVSP